LSIIVSDVSYSYESPYCGKKAGEERIALLKTGDAVPPLAVR